MSPLIPQLERLNYFPIHLNEGIILGEHEGLLLARLLEGQFGASQLIWHGIDGAALGVIYWGCMCVCRCHARCRSIRGRFQIGRQCI